MKKSSIGLTRSMAQSVTRRAALKRFGVGIAALASVFALPVPAPAATLGPLIELSRPNAVGACDTSFPANFRLLATCAMPRVPSFA